MIDALSFLIGAITGLVIGFFVTFVIMLAYIKDKEQRHIFMPNDD